MKTNALVKKKLHKKQHHLINYSNIILNQTERIKNGNGNKHRFQYNTNKNNKYYCKQKKQNVDINDNSER